MKLVELRLKQSKVIVFWLFSAEGEGGNPLPKDLLKVINLKGFQGQPEELMEER